MGNIIQFSSETKNLILAENLIDEVSDKHQLSSEIYGNMLISIIEAVNNAITHGNKMNPQKNVTIELEFKEGILKFLISDEGPGFNFTVIPDPTSSENIEKPHGRGIYLMQHLADEVNFYNNGSQVELIFKVS